jgi:hypothetical protein
LAGHCGSRPPALLCRAPTRPRVADRSQEPGRLPAPSPEGRGGRAAQPHGERVSVRRLVFRRSGHARRHAP